ncbi:MAG: proline--tRNA ligase [Phycisphaerales bacterium]|nr:proline--tRNA ligase [Phycisphaerales bacterium]
MSTINAQADNASRHAALNATAGCVHNWSQTLVPTTREAPSDAETPSHIFLVRAGYIRQVGAGIYNYLPLAWRSLKKISAIVREEMDAAGASEFLMPALMPIELYKDTKRDVDYGNLLFTLEDRHGRRSALGPTHEEVITDLMCGAVTSYKQFPLNLYQIQSKFRDEARPRAGLLRCREFIMKDAYSFHLELEGDAGLNHTYDKMYQAYTNIFTRCGLDFSAVEAEAGPIGGSASHEFMVNCANGEDTILHCPSSGYTANVEKAEIGERTWSFDVAPSAEITKHHTPNMPGIDLVAEHLGVQPAGMLKSIVFRRVGTEAKWVVAVVRGDHDVNEGKVRDAVGTAVELAPEAEARAAGFAIGYVSPRTIDTIKMTLVVDPDALNAESWATGADEKDHHITGFNWSRDMADAIAGGKVKVADIRNAEAGDPSPRAPGAFLETRRGIEVGHIFKLGTKYSSAMGLSVLNKEQKKQDVIMGCYGIGVSRTLSACIESAHDENGIIWPLAIAPYHAQIVVIRPDDEGVMDEANKLAAELSQQGFDVLIDDRDDRPGSKFKDADLIGIPLRFIISPKTIESGEIEFKARADEGKAELIKREDAVRAALAKCESIA